MVFLNPEQRPVSTKDILSWIFDKPEYDQNRPVIIDAADPTRSLSANQSLKLIRQLIAGFQSAGLKKGDCVCLHSFNDIYYPIIAVGVIAAGGIFTGTNPAYTTHELTHTLKAAGVKWLISEPEVVSPLLVAAKSRGIPDSNIWIFDTMKQQVIPKGMKSWKSLLQHGEKDWERFEGTEVCSKTVAMRLFSSGTTGLPKAVDVSHYNFIAQHELIWDGPDQKGWNDIHLFPLPMFHAAIAFRAHTTTLKKGDLTYIMRRFDLEEFLINIKKYRVTTLSVVPAMAISIIMSPLAKKEIFKSVRWCLSGAAPMRPETQARLQSLLPEKCPLTQVWGMTESSCIATRFAFPEQDTTGSIGRPISNVDMKLVDEDGNDIGEVYDTPGEMCVRGPTIVPGYYNNRKANEESFDADGFYHTGDIGYCSSSTRLWYIIDRKKELIKVRGYQVAPPELEGILLDHPDIVDCAVIGAKFKDMANGGSGEMLELPRAYVVRRPGVGERDLTEEMVKEYVKPKLARYKWLEGGVRFVESVPKSPNGKILKRILREEVEREVAVNGTPKL